MRVSGWRGMGGESVRVCGVADDDGVSSDPGIEGVLVAELPATDGRSVAGSEGSVAFRGREGGGTDLRRRWTSGVNEL